MELNGNKLIVYKILFLRIFYFAESFNSIEITPYTITPPPPPPAPSKNPPSPAHPIENKGYHMAYFWVHSLACWRYLELSFLKSFAISGTRGSSGLGSQSKEQMDNRTLEMVRAGDH